MNTEIVYLKGLFRGLEATCYGCNYVPIYGAVEFNLNHGYVHRSLEKAIGKQGSASELTNLPSQDWKKNLRKLLKKWVGSRILEGTGATSEVNFSIQKIIEFIRDVIDDILGVDFDAYSFQIDHADEYGFEAEGMLFTSKEASFFIHFGWWD